MSYGDTNARPVRSLSRPGFVCLRYRIRYLRQVLGRLRATDRYADANGHADENADTEQHADANTSAWA